MASAVNEVHSKVRYEFEDQNLNIRIISDVHPWKFILPDPNSGSTMEESENEIESLLEILCNREDGSYLFDYRILRKEDSCQLGPIFKFKSAHHDTNLIWGNSTISIISEEYVDKPESDPTEVTISLHLPSDIDQADLFSKIKKLNKTIIPLQDRKEYIPSGTPMFGKKGDEDKEFFEEPGNFPE